jgi:competence protein ComEA
MSTPTRPQLLGLAALGLVVVVLGALWARGGHAADGGSAGDATTAAAVATVSVDDGAGGGGSAATIVVHVAGAVRHPGVYRLRDGMRVAGAIREAGGATRRANLDALNLAAKLADGRQVLVPARPQVAHAGAAAATPSGTAAADSGLPVNLNSATLEELDALDGIGPTTAQKIIDYREQHGGFANVDELDQVPGIGPATVASLRDFVTA